MIAKLGDVHGDVGGVGGGLVAHRGIKQVEQSLRLSCKRDSYAILSLASSSSIYHPFNTLPLIPVVSPDCIVQLQDGNGHLRQEAMDDW